MSKNGNIWFIVGFIGFTFLLSTAIISCTPKESESPINHAAKVAGEKINRNATEAIIKDGVATSFDTNPEAQVTTDQVISNLIYMEDPRTNTCYAYIWRGAANGGPAFTLVPCDSIPARMRHVAAIK